MCDQAQRLVRPVIEMITNKIHPRPASITIQATDGPCPTSSSAAAEGDEEVLLLNLLSPLLNLGYYSGLFPFRTGHASKIEHSRFCHFFVFVGSFLGASDLAFHLYSIYNSIAVDGVGVLDVITQTVWITSAVVSITINLKSLFHHRGVEQFFENWKQLEPCVVHLVSRRNAKLCTWICYTVYSLLSFTSIGFCLFHSLRVPAYPVYPLHFLAHEGGNAGTSFSWWIIAINSTVQTIRVAWVWVGTAMLECFSTVVATFITLALKGINVELEFFYKRHPNTEEIMDGMRNESFEGQGQRYARQKMGASPEYADDDKLAEETINWRTCPLLVSIRQYQVLNDLQTLVNDFIGFILFVNFAQLVVLICTLCFLPLKYQDNFDFNFALVFSGNGACFAFRLITLIICIGNVYPAAQSTNIEFGKVITRRYFPNQVLNPVLGHLSIYSASPICFSAWGFFAITKGTLLTCLSVIITYLLVFLQLKSI